MINIKDKLSRTNLLLPRTQDAVADYVTEDVFYNQITEITKELDELEDGIRNSYNTGVTEGIRQQKDKLESITISKNGEYNKEDGYNKVVVNVAVEGNYEDGYEDGIAEGVRQQKGKLGSITISENGEYLKEDGYNKVVVNVEGTIFNFNEIGYSNADADNVFDKINADIAYSARKWQEWNAWVDDIMEVKEFFKDDKDIVYCPSINTETVTDMSYFFSNCEHLQYVPMLNTSNVTTMDDMFSNCLSIQKLPNFDTSNVISMNRMFAQCSLLREIPEIDTSKVTSVVNMVSQCLRLEKIPLLDFGNVTDIRNFFTSLYNNNLTDLGGFKNLKIDWDDGFGLAGCPRLTHESLLNVINNLYDFRANGDTTTVKKLEISIQSLSRLSDDEIAIATNKGWILTA